MFDGVTLDQLRTFIAAVDEGSFSAAGRKLRRAQSVVSHTLATLEAQLGVKLFERTARNPQLTDAGKSLLRDARSVAESMDGFKARARAMREGLEPELSVAMDVMYPMDSLTRAAAQSYMDYPHTPLRLYVEALGGVMKLVLDRSCSIGVIGTLPIIMDELQVEYLRELEMVAVVSPAHPLANFHGPVPSVAINKHVQLVLSDRTVLSEGREFGVMSSLTWRLADLGAKYAFLKAALGWGHMPLHMIKSDLESGRLVTIHVEGLQPSSIMPMKVVYRKDAPPGPAARAFIAQLGK